MERSIHDNFILGYSVDCQERVITICTEYRERGEPFEQTHIRFEGVLGYLLRDGLEGVLFEIEEDSIDRILFDHAADFTWGDKYGWPWANATSGNLREVIEARAAKVFRIQGQTCFDGFVIASSMTLLTA
jgi:hypothetical protein